jgi:hypothetical protein
VIPPPDEDDGVVIEHPNRAKASSRATRATVIALLLASALVVAVVTIGGWDALQGAKAMQIAYVVVYVGIAFYVARWKRGVLPVAAALAILLLIFAAISGPQWLERDRDGFAEPAIDAGLLALITLLLIPLEALLIAFAMRGFGQAWHVEVERRPGAAGRTAARAA